MYHPIFNNMHLMTIQELRTNLSWFGWFSRSDPRLFFVCKKIAEMIVLKERRFRNGKASKNVPQGF